MISVISFNVLLFPIMGVGIEKNLDKVGFEIEGKIISISDTIEDPAIENLIKDIDLLKQKISESSEDCWRKPKSIRKFIIIKKLDVIQGIIGDGNYEEAYDKTLYDIKPKLSGLKTDENEESWGKGVFKKPWVICDDLKAEFRLDCNNILSQIRSLFEPVQDITPPEIIIAPMDPTITDEEGIGGFSVQWVITDESGIGWASVSLNGDTIVDYGAVDSILDYAVLPNTLGNSILQITATDTNGLEASAQSTISVVDDDTTAPVISIDYVGSGTDYDPGWWTVTIEDLESGLAEITILVNGFEMEHETNLNGQISYQIDTPVSINTHTIEVIAVNNDNDRESDQESSTETDSVTIIPDPIFFIPM